MDVRAARAVEYFTENNAGIALFGGAARQEVMIMNGLINGVSGEVGGMMGYAYRDRMTLTAPDPQNRGDVYDYTHAVMFATDFGNSSITVGASHRELIDRLIPEYTDDLDVLGEILIAAKCIGYDSPVVQAGMDVFTHAWDTNSFKLPFGEQYHLVVVGGILFSR